MTLAFSHELQMSDDEYLLIRDIIYGHCGIYFDANSRYILEKRLSHRLEELKLSSFIDYYQYLKHHANKDNEFINVMDVITTNETYFFRESFQLKAFSDEIVPELIKVKSARGSRSLRIWSAGCSTGEEPYSIAMLLSDIPHLKEWNIEIFGTDISQKVLQRARRAVYGKSSFRTTEELQLDLFFDKHGEEYKVKDYIREHVNISCLNLFDSNQMAMLGKMDIIFCRNVIIYFDLAAKSRVIESLYNSLYDGGFLLLGHSESLMNLKTRFKLRHFINDMVYQKPDRLLLGGVK